MVYSKLVLLLTQHTPQYNIKKPSSSTDLTRSLINQNFVTPLSLALAGENLPMHDDTSLLPLEYSTIK